MNQLQKIINLYLDITSDCSINKLGTPFAYYYADDIDSNIKNSNLQEIDMKDAFASIIKFKLGTNHPFCIEIDKINNKKEKVIYISTTITNENKKGNYFITLNEINILTKVVILGYVYANNKNIQIIEYKKDGLAYNGNSLSSSSITSETSQFNEIIRENFKFHKYNYNLYFRIYKTSYFLDYNNKLIIKGNYKNLPPFISNILHRFLCEREIYNSELLYDIKKKYSKLYLEILLQSNLINDINELYKINNGYLDVNGKIQTDIQQLHPHSYLYYILFPILSLLRS